MANTLYAKGADKFLTANIDLVNDTIKVALLPTTYTFSHTHEFLSALGPRIATDQTLTNRSITGGVFDADDIDFGFQAPGANIKAIALYKDTGNPSTSPTLVYYDTVSSLPFATNGGAFSIPWNDGPGKILHMGRPFYPSGGELVLAGRVNFLTAALKAVAVPSSYVYDPAHKFVSDLGATLYPAAVMTGRTISNGVFGAADYDMGQLVSGPEIGSVVIYVDTGNPATSPLISQYTDATGLPLTPFGGGVKMEWSRGSAKVFSMLPA